MKHINNYIQEKLHIGKNDNVDHYPMESKDFFEYIVDNGCDFESEARPFEISNEGEDVSYMTIYLDKKDSENPWLWLQTDRECFNDRWLDFKERKITINSPNGAEHELKTNDFDIDEHMECDSGDEGGYLYTKHNADLLINALKKYK